MNNNLPTTQSNGTHMPMPVDPSLYSGHYQEEHVAGLDLREIWQVVYKYRRLTIASVVICALLSLIFAFTATPLYRAEAKIRISTYEPVLTATKIEDLLQQKSKETTYFETQLQEIKSLSLADEVLRDHQLKNELFPETSLGGGLFGFGESKKEAQRAETGAYSSTLPELKGYLGLIEVEPVRRTSLVMISATTPSRELSAKVANKHAATYIDWVRKVRVEQQARSLTFLNEQAEELRERTSDLEREMAEYAEANSIVALNKDENITVQKMSQLNKLMTDATAKRIEAENLWKEADGALSSPSAGFDDPSTQNMRTQLASLEAEYSQLSSKFTASYPKMVQLRSQIEGLKKSIESQRRQVVLGLKAKAQAAAEEERKIQGELDRQKSEAFELSKSQVQFNVLKRELTTSRDMLQNVLRQIKETALAVESNASNVSVVDYAVTPTQASYPKKRKIVMLGLLAGLGLGLLLSFLLSRLDNSVRTPDQVSHYLALHCLGVVPSFESESKHLGDLGAETPVTESHPVPLGGDGGQVPVVYVRAPKSLAAEAYRTIRTGILLSQAGHPPKTILVSSAQSGEGKTTSSINLAACFASAGGRVALIDADLRRPSVSRYFGIDTSLPGLVDVITGQAELESVMVETPIRRIMLLPSGKIPPNPAELLGSMEMAAILDRLAANFDYLVIDSPPILPVTDSVILSRYVDGVALVVRAAGTPRKVVQDAKRRLAAVGARFLGVVLNDADVTGGDYYYYNRYYYSYYSGDSQHRERRAAG